MGHPPFAVTVDLVVLTIRKTRLHCLLVQRGGEPYARSWALPGGFVRIDERLQDAAYRELVEETGVGEGLHVEQLGTYGDPDRDPRMRTVSVAWLALAPELPEPVAGSDAAGARWLPIEQALEMPLAFDHHQILAAGLERARGKLEYTPLAGAFCPPEFTISQLRQVYEAVWGESLDPRNFHRKVTKTPGFLMPTFRTVVPEAGRPAQLYRRGTLDLLNPPISRST